MAAGVVDPSGVLVYYEKMDNTQIGRANVSIGKARSAALFKRPTKAFQDMVAGGGAGLRILTLENAVAIEGGVPIIVNGRLSAPWAFPATPQTTTASVQRRALRP
jgi:uncharacterized protein GlcG (DUF336 family)